MKSLLALPMALFAAILQVSVAPLFPLEGAVVDFGLVAILAAALSLGPRGAMVTTPLCALFVAFAANRAPALILLAYLPLAPLSALLLTAPLPLGRWLRLLGALGIAGLWARGLLSLAAFAGGAPFSALALIGEVLVPGLIFDALFATILFVSWRLMPRQRDTNFTLRRTRGWA